MNDANEPDSPKYDLRILNSDGGIDGMYESKQRLQSFKKQVTQQPPTSSDPSGIFETSYPKQPEKENDDNRFELSTGDKSLSKTDDARKLQKQESIINMIPNNSNQ